VLQGGWAYTARGDGGAVEHVAATRAAEDAAWLLVACSADERLIVSLIHTEQFPFPLNRSSSVQLRSNNVPSVSIEGKSIQNNQIFVDPRPMRHIMPLLMQDDQLVVSILGQDGAMHNYTFSMQPNDVALRPIAEHGEEKRVLDRGVRRERDGVLFALRLDVLAEQLLADE
jgi:hypothetical protein